MNNNKEGIWKIAGAVGALLVIFLAVLSIKELKSIAYVGKDTPIMNSISVSGKGETVAIPDVATFSFGVTETAKTVSLAQTSATEKTNSALKVVRDLGVADKDIKTLSYWISPHYEYQKSICPTVYSAGESYCPPSRSVLTGYDVGQTIQVKIRDIDKAGDILSAIGTVKVNNVSGLNFSVDDIESVKAEARDKAIENAKTKAQELAKQLGVKLGKIISFYESGDDPYYAYGKGGDSRIMTLEAAAAPSPEVPAGEQEIVSNVSIVYEIK